MSATGSPAQFSIVVPVLNDDVALEKLLKHLDCTGRELGRDDLTHALVIADAGSSNARQIAQNHGARYLHTAPSRGGQIAAAIAAVDTPWIWILHADTVPSQLAVQQVMCVVTQALPKWGRCAVVLPGLPLVAGMMNWRSRWTRICTGDQAQFMHRSLLIKAGGFPVQPLMEDIEVSKRLKSVAAGDFVALDAEVISSPRRWRRYGILKTILNMWRYRLRYFFGADAEALYMEYYGVSKRVD